ncbi:MAG: universal stress protein [Phascolarctobacterium sp.]|uniref:universal stress protein n=1 Tax=Phascolarctobacterium sp. TaxID=2049039 RepID=UPI0026DAB108|nr:universal stress protein [Phascolarctobacterium sp.]MDO4920387.1 universal stress protein [Phascolarctobacterium sp.]
MSTFTKVLLATDLSPQADKLTECLFSLCPDTETEVVLAHVFEDDDDADPDGSSYKKARSRLEGYKNDIEQAGYEDISIVTPSGETAPALAALAEECEADLLLVASHRKGFLKRALMGSTTYELARAANLPLLINKDEEDETTGNLLETVLLPTDFSRKSLEGLNIIRSLREFVGRVIFVHVIEHSRSKRDYKEKYGSAMLFLQELVDEMKIFGIDADYRIAHGVASKKIAAICERDNVSLIMLAKTGADMTSGDDLGSTSENVVLNSDCAVMLLPAEDNDD